MFSHSNISCNVRLTTSLHTILSLCVPVLIRLSEMNVGTADLAQDLGLNLFVLLTQQGPVRKSVFLLPFESRGPHQSSGRGGVEVTLTSY